LDPDDRIARMAAALEEAGLAECLPFAASLAEYLERVLEANTSFNLTAVRDRDEAVWLHVVDSLLGLPYVDKAPPGSLADLGSGAGFPGVPLLLCSGRPGLLVESVGKKARFLEVAAGALCPSARVVCRRAEELAGEEPGSQSVVTARALAALPSLVELGSPLLSVGGVLVAYKGSPSEEEMERGRKAAARAGMRELEAVRLTLPRPQRAERTLVLYEKTGPPEMRLPRRIGLAQKEPLA
jgi:16S rRNA (guanine527-N7)-methyltransferase